MANKYVSSRNDKPGVWAGDLPRLYRTEALFETGIPISPIAEELGVTKNTISGLCWRLGWTRREMPVFTTLDRLDMLEGKFDAVMSIPVTGSALNGSRKAKKPIDKGAYVPINGKGETRIGF